MSPKHVIVLGAGMIGTCTALQLTLRGHSVVMLDRGAPGRETSYGNAGLISARPSSPTPSRTKQPCCCAWP